MNLNLLKWQLLRGTLLRRVVLRTFMFMVALVVLSFLQMAHDLRIIEPVMPEFDACSSTTGSKHELNLTTGSSNSELMFPFPLFGTYKMSNKESRNLTMTVFKELAKKNLLQSNARALCVGDGSAYATSLLRRLGFTNAVAIEKHPSFSILKRKFVYELEFKDNDFDFVFSGDLDRVSVPSLLVSELERVLSPGGTGAVIVGAREFYTGGLVRQIPVVSFLKSSDAVRICSVGSFTLVIFKKRLEMFDNLQLPRNCPSVENNKPFMKYIEPLAEHSFAPKLSYLPEFVNISSRNKLVYMNIGAGEFAKSSIAKISEGYGLSSHPRAAFEAFIVDHNTSVLASFSSDPGFNFVYYPFFSGESYAAEISSDEHLSAPMEEEEGFDLGLWFEETVSDGDFTVLVMNAKSETLSVLADLFRTGLICRVDELFLICEKGEFSGCSNVSKSLRKRGVYAHLWPVGKLRGEKATEEYEVL